MAKVKKRKRPCPHDNAPNKKVKRPPSPLPNYSPAFWDGLSKIDISCRALRELDRRNNLKLPQSILEPAVKPDTVIRFARLGGPDLSHLRSYSQSRSPTMAARLRRQTLSVDPTPNASPKSKFRKSTWNDANFERHLVEHNVFFTGGPVPTAHDRERLTRRRESLSELNYPESAFKDFDDANNDAFKNVDVLHKVVPIIEGPNRLRFYNMINVEFTDMQPITGDKTVTPQPHFCDGARYRDLDARIRQDLSKLVIPLKSGADRRPVVPNFFLTVMGQDGAQRVGKRQAALAGAYGARAIHSLRAWMGHGGDELWDRKAYCYSATYHPDDHTLKLFQHFVLAQEADNKPEYHMALLKTYELLTHSDFIEGVTAFRNAREIAKQLRDEVIQAANSRAQALANNPPPPPPPPSVMQPLFSPVMHGALPPDLEQQDPLPLLDAVGWEKFLAEHPVGQDDSFMSDQPDLSFPVSSPDGRAYLVQSLEDNVVGEEIFKPANSGLDYSEDQS
ncbi:hypothetical protein B0T17DRAFT_600818 [Bombardia bombarda]|uniref:DUF7924 domain-containing protein n=1 Tax=Bombardia bombarda TaxID=252184 RepID=A0AA39WLV0_9PEZI|nr:hypothetical protein B0T17DRAFT_600818 [Bombardia bombarda]